MADEIEPIIDINGEERRCGSLIVSPELLRVSFAFEQDLEPLDDAIIRRMVQDPNRRPARVRFPAVDFNQNQHTEPSCNGYAGSGAIRKRIVMQKKPDTGRLSGADLYSRIHGGRNQGSALQDAMVELFNGIAPESLVTWQMVFERMQPPGTAAARKKILGLELLPLPTIQHLKTALAFAYPCIVAVHAGGNFQRLNSQGVAGVDNGGGNHAVHCDDLRLDGSRWQFDMDNSWGLSYGTDGRAWLTEDHFVQTQRNHRFYGIGAVKVA